MMTGTDVVMDMDALEAIVTNGKSYAINMEVACNDILAEANKLENDDSLTGGDGDTIRESLKEIKESCKNLQNSMNVIAKELDNKLGVGYKMVGKMSSLKDETKKATQKVGVLKDKE